MFYVKLSRPNLREGKSILADTAQHRNKRAINILGLENRKKKKLTIKEQGCFPKRQIKPDAILGQHLISKWKGHLEHCHSAAGKRSHKTSLICSWT